MDLFEITFQAVFTLIGIGFLGFWILQRRILPQNIIGFLTPLAIDIAIPCLVFTSIIKNFDPVSHGNWFQLPVWWLVFSFIVLFLTIILSFTAKPEYRAEFRVALMYHNAIFIPVGIITGIFGGDSVYIADLFLFTVVYPVFFFNTYHLFYRNKKTNDGPGPGSLLRWSMLRNPILIATVISLSLKLSGTSVFVPEVVISITSTVAGMALPLIMLIIGGSIYIDLQKREPFQIREMLLFVLSKNFIFPAVFLGLIYIIRPDYNISLMLIIAASVPPITAVPIVTERAGGNRGVANQMMTASFLAALISIPLAIWVFSILYPS